MRIAKLTAEIGADITQFRAACKEAERELVTVTKLQEKLGNTTVANNKRIQESEQQLVNTSHQLLSAERSLETAHNGRIKQLLNVEKTQIRLKEAREAEAKVANNQNATEEQRARAIAKVENLERNLMQTQIQLANAQNTLVKAEDNLVRVRKSSILVMQKHEELLAAEAKLAVATGKAKVQALDAAEKARRAYTDVVIAEIEQERIARRKEEIEYNEYWQKRLAKEDALAEKQRKLAESQSQQLTMMGRLSGAYSSLHKTQTFLSNSATSLSTTVTLPFALAAKSAFDAAVELESYQNSLATIMKSQTGALAEMEELKKASRLPGVDLKGLVSASVSLQAVGSSAAEARRFVTEFGNQIALTGGGLMEFERTVINIRQLVGAKSLSGQEFKQMAHDIPTMLTAIKALYGTINTKELSARGITGKQVLSDLTEYFAKSQRAAQSAKNDLKNFNNELFILKAEIGNELIPIFREFVNIVMPIFRNLVSEFKALSPEMRRTIILAGIFAATLGPAMGLMAGLIGVLRAGIGIFVGVGTAIKTIQGAFAILAVTTKGAGLATVFTEIGVAAQVAGVTSASAFTAALIPLLPYIAAVAAVGLAIYGLKTAWDAAVNAGIKSEEQMIREAALETKRIQKKAEVAKQVAVLAEEYEKLRNKVGPLNENELARLNKLFNDIAILNPKLVQGYDSQGNAIHGLTQKYVDLKVAAEQAAEAQRKSAFTDQFAGKYQPLQDKLNAAKNNLDDILKNGYNKFAGYHDSQPMYVREKSGADYNKALAEAKNAVTSLTAEMKTLKTEMKSASDASKGIFGDKGTTSNSGTGGGKTNLNFYKSEGLQKGLKESLAQMMAERPGISAFSGYRSIARQKELFDEAVKKYGSVKEARKWVAPPGSSEHNYGRAVDLSFKSDADRKWAHANAPRFGLHFPMSWEPWHIEKIGGRSKDKGSRDKAYATQAREVESLQQKIARHLGTQKEKTAELRAQMVPLTEDMKYQAMYQKMIADKQSEFGANLPSSIKDEIQRNVVARRTLDVWQKNLEVRQKINDLIMDNRLAGMSEEDRAVISAFGAKDWYDKNIDQSKKDEFKKQFLTKFNREKTLSFDSGAETSQYMKDLKEIGSIYGSIVSPLTKNSAMLKAQLQGTFDPRQNALNEFLDANKEAIREFEFLSEMSGLPSFDFAKAFLDNYDLNVEATKTAAYAREIGQVNNQFKALTTSGFENWINSQLQWNEALQKFELPDYLKDQARARELFDGMQRNQTQEQFNSILGDTNRRMAELSANGLFERWAVSLQQIDQQGNLQPLLMDMEVLKKMFQDQQLMDLIETFADGVRGIFSDMIYDIAENGFKGMFANIYAGFQQLLFKMAVEYLASVLYQSLLGSLFSGFGLGSVTGGKSGGGGGGFVPNLGLVEGSYANGGYVSRNQLIQVGEHGKELFMPMTDGYIIPNHVINNFTSENKRMVNSIGGSASLAKYNSVLSSSSYGDAVTDNSSTRTSNTDNSRVVIINNHYHSGGGSSSRSTKSVSQQIREADQEMDRVRSRLG